MHALRTAGTVMALGALAAAQDPATATTDPAVLRARRDLAAAADTLAAHAHAFAGRIAYAGAPTDELTSFEYAFTGAAGGAFDWFTLDEWCTARNGARTIVRRDRAAWSKPQGDSPDLPLSPRLFVPHLPHAALARPEPSEFRGRPALRVHATWRGEAAKLLVRELALPSTRHAARFGSVLQTGFVGAYVVAFLVGALWILYVVVP
jgi:hypothetical protein